MVKFSQREFFAWSDSKQPKKQFKLLIGCEHGERYFEAGGVGDGNNEREDAVGGGGAGAAEEGDAAPAGLAGNLV